jgi:type VI secretion system secreted protein Hcp
MKKLLILPTMAAMVLLLAGIVQGAGFIKFDGVEGESTSSGHEGEIDILSFSWGMSQSGGTTAGRGGGAGKVSMNDLVFTKYVDKASPALMEAVASGKHIPNVVLEIERSPGGDERVPYLKYELKNVIVTSYNVDWNSSQADSVPTEEMSLNFEEIKVTYVERELDGSKGGVFSFLWNFLKNTGGSEEESEGPVLV